ncbi:MAG: methionyl-tRNA formyltransferase [Alphaproteobacteria bacterium]
MPRPARLRLAFLGTPRFAVSTLDALVAAGHDVVRVYSQPPRPAGRGQQERRSDVHERANALGLVVATPKSLKDPAEQTAFAALGLDVAVVVAYGLILPKPILDAPRLGCVNVHASLLPRWRGAAPIQRAILAGDAETGVTIMRMDEGLDTGAMLLEERMAIGPDDTAETLHDTLAALGAKLIVPALDGLAAGTLSARPQPAEGVTYASKLTRAEGRLDWSKAAAALARQVRAFAPWPGAWFDHGNEQIKVLAAEAVAGKQDAAPGTVLDDVLTVACGKGALRLSRLQRPGRGPMDAASLLRGFALPRGTRLGAEG